MTLDPPEDRALREQLTVGAAVNVLFWVEVAKALKAPIWLGAASSITAMRLASRFPADKLGPLEAPVKILNLPGSLASQVLVPQGTLENPRGCGCKDK